jgi:hypothetical protein
MWTYLWLLQFHLFKATFRNPHAQCLPVLAQVRIRLLPRHWSGVRGLCWAALNLTLRKVVRNAPYDDDDNVSGLRCFHGCFYCLDYVVPLWFELRNCLCLYL